MNTIRLTDKELNTLALALDIALQTFAQIIQGSEAVPAELSIHLPHAA